MDVGVAGIAGVSVARTRVTERPVPQKPDSKIGVGTLVAESLESQTFVQVQGLTHRPAVIQARHAGSWTLTAGPYRVSFRLGSRVFSQTDVYVLPDKEIRVTATAQQSRLIQELFDNHDGISQTYDDAVGSVQGDLVPVLLTMIGATSLSAEHLLFPWLVVVPSRTRFARADKSPISIVIAIDGDRWPVSASEVIREIKFGWESGDTTQEIPVAPLGRGGQGIGRMALRRCWRQQRHLFSAFTRDTLAIRR